jgi:hypothetical protein
LLRVPVRLSSVDARCVPSGQTEVLKKLIDHCETQAAAQQIKHAALAEQLKWDLIAMRGISFEKNFWSRQASQYRLALKEVDTSLSDR